MCGKNIYQRTELTAALAQRTCRRRRCRRSIYYKGFHIARTIRTIYHRTIWKSWVAVGYSEGNVGLWIVECVRVQICGNTDIGMYDNNSAAVLARMCDCWRYLCNSRLARNIYTILSRDWCAVLDLIFYRFWWETIETSLNGILSRNTIIRLSLNIRMIEK